ncbi:NAD-binding protein [Synechococcus sp. Cruz-9H2]|nr:NAD-binding protein [Synechococcus sp. Cruz-9H2]MCP9844830.1 NAD-binding protein [Synechococcus sp. Edmonson 11F2]MCP9856889.1 NAD-binding protein [Synechococcus sp. Cruz-9C9]MCP9864175.1 NAD-binding protein [Synechococcus sp. Cruz-7E5]MCP9871507.1 NAD-binding protein [Synechococcus sp. Cruz-7B9]
MGSLGKTCLLRLLPFEVPLRCIDLVPPVWSQSELCGVLEEGLTLGDMRRPEVLKRAEVSHARAVLLLSSRSSVNFEAALQVRLLNPAAEIVVRSSSQDASFGALLEQHLPGVAVVDPTLLTAGAVAQALRPGNQQACFEVDGQHFEVFVPKDSGEEERALAQSRHFRRLHLPPEFHWGEDPAQTTIVTLLGFRASEGHHTQDPETGESESIAYRLTHGLDQRGPLITYLLRHPSRWYEWLRLRPAVQWASAGLIGLLLVFGIAAFSQNGGWKQGMFVTLALLKGEYVDPVNVLLQQKGQHDLSAIAGPLIAGTLLYSLIGTLLTSALVAVILDRLLSARFGLDRPRHLRRGSSQILLVGGGNLAEGVAKELWAERHAVIRVEPTAAATAIGTQTINSYKPVIVERLEQALTLLSQCHVEAIGLLSADLLANLSLALTLQQRWPGARVGILAPAVESAGQLGALLGGLRVVSITDLAADAFVATAFGERVEGVRRIHGSNLLLVRYRVGAADSLQGRSVARIQEGYGVTVITLSQRHTGMARSLPAPDTLLGEGDQLVVLADLNGLRRIEGGEAQPPRWQLWLQADPAGELRFEAQQCLARNLGCLPGAVAHLLDGQLHHTDPLDADLAAPLEKHLRRLGVRCGLEPCEI